jgi:exopolyphosphatase/guanosine-5'-triphosphate,3'-diphosphate pyrophosphatase
MKYLYLIVFFVLSTFTHVHTDVERRAAIDNSIRPLASEDGVITRKGLRRVIEDSLNKTDEELNNPFAHVDVSNCILTLAIMKALHIQEIRPIETTTTRGLLVSPTYWMKDY